MTLRKIFNVSNYALVTALAISAIAAWYSIQGLMAIFSAAVVPIVIMGTALEVGKVVTTVWLHDYWDRAGWKLKLYLVPAVVILAFITSMGIFGFLSKAHSDQSLVSGDVQSKIAIYDEKIKTARENIESDRKQLRQMDDAVDQVMSRSTTEQGADRSNAIRKSQQHDRIALAKDIETQQKIIVSLNDESAPIRADVRKVAAEVGPIKYIAALIYGDNPSSDLLERAVRWVIIILVLVFDPLALCLVIAAITSREWDKERWADEENTLDPYVADVGEKPSLEETDEIEHVGTYEEELSSDIVELEQPEIILCHKCGTPLENATGIGPFCPNKECDVVDGPFVEEEPEPATLTVDSDLPISTTDEIRTEGVTQLNPIKYSEGDYVATDDGLYRRNAFLHLRPDLGPFIETANKINTNFGTSFPNIANKGDIFVRVDLLPNKIFRFEGNKWIEINKENTDTHLTNDYLEHLVEKINKGEYDIEHLTEVEAASIEEYLKNKNVE